MIDQGVDAICLLANFSEQFLLTDDERDRLTELGLTHVAGRVPVIVTCSHFQYSHLRRARATRSGIRSSRCIRPRGPACSNLRPT
jgi:2-keto-3-deoxy-L-arabinonate dehydratase